MDYGKNIKNKPFIQSIIPFCQNDMKVMLYDINNSNSKKLVELNLSCLNLINKSIVGYDFECFEKYLSDLNNYKIDNLRVGLKLPPYYELRTFEIVSNLIQKYSNNIKFLTCINSIVDGLSIDINTQKTKIYPKCGFGGIGGEYCRPTALANVNRFYKFLGNKIDIVGCGGISKGVHVFEHILCGASAVEIGSQLIKEGSKCFSRIIKEFEAIMVDKKFNHISSFKGKLK